MGVRSSKIYLASDSQEEQVCDVVELFLADRVESICRRKQQNLILDHQTPVAFGAVRLESSSVPIGLHGLKSVKSLKALASFAHRQHAKQDAQYIPAEVVSASFLTKLNSKDGSFEERVSAESLNPTGSLLNIFTSNEVPKVLEAIDETQPAVEDFSLPVPSREIERHFEHKHKHHRIITDDADWIPVSDDEVDDESNASVYTHGLRALGKQGGQGVPLNSSGNRIGSSNNSSNNNSGSPLNVGSGNKLLSPQGSGHQNVPPSSTPPPFKKPALNIPSANAPTAADGQHGLTAYQSYMFTKSGTMLLSGFSGAIGTTGIQPTILSGQSTPLAGNSDSSASSSDKLSEADRRSSILQLNMRERFVLLCKLGQGASGIVYKALDLSEMRFVALKIIPVFERYGRNLGG